MDFAKLKEKVGAALKSLALGENVRAKDELWRLENIRNWLEDARLDVENTSEAEREWIYDVLRALNELIGRGYTVRRTLKQYELFLSLEEEVGKDVAKNQ